MGLVRTVQGDIPPRTLGWCQCHEHLFISDGPSRTVDPSLCMDDREKTLTELSLYREAGGRALVDAQPYGCGRMAENLVEVSRLSGVHIVASTGFHKTVFMEDSEIFTAQSEDAIAGLYTSEIMDGMTGRNGGRLESKAGIVKCAAVPGWISDTTYHKLFSAAAGAAHSTGAPVMVHLDPGADALGVIRFYTDAGIAADRVILCHLDRVRYDMGYHREVAETGAYLEYDTIHRLKYHSDEAEAELIAHMVENGYDDRLLMGMDTTSKRLKSYGADFGLDFILTEYARLLGEYGIDPEILHTLMVQNPQNALAVK